MHTHILNLSWQSAQEDAMRLLQNHGILVAPTDTVYGVMCRYDSQIAVRHLFEIKQRPLGKAVPVLIGDRDQLPRIALTPLSAAAKLLAEVFWPGPLTLILPAHKDLPDALTAEGTTVGVRMPDHGALRDLLRRAGPLAATSANRSGASEACSAQEALDQLGGLVPLILSDDDTAIRPHRPLASTIVDLTDSEPVVVRQGPIANEVLDLLTHSGDTQC